MNRPPRACAERYQPLRLLGEGGFASVWLANQRGLDREVVVKVLHAELLDSPTLVERFLNEARITATLSHPNIVILIDHGVDDGVPWIAYEYLPRGTLSAAIARGPMPWRDALAAAGQIASALAEAHAHDVLHRDIKPANVLEAAPGTWKVLDFGVAKWTRATNQTKEGLLVGSPAYLAPEQLVGAPASPQSDLYALGVVLYQAIAGALPPRGAPASGASLNAPPAARQVIDRLLALDPEDRPATAADAARELAEAARRPSPRTRAALAPTPVHGSPRPRARYAAAALAVGALVAGAVSWALRPVAPPADAWTPLPDATPSARPRPRSPAEALKQAVERYQQAPAGDRRVRWGWLREPGLAEAIRAAIADDPAQAPRLFAWLRGIEESERANPLYWACRGLARSSPAAARDLTDVDRAALEALADAYTGLYLTLQKPYPHEVAEATLLATERARSWRPRNPLFEDEWTAWRLVHLHHAQALTAGHLPEPLAGRLSERLDELHRLRPAPRETPGARPGALGLALPATPELAAFARLTSDVAAVLPALAPLELSLAFRAARRVLGDERLAQVDRWVEALEPWGAPRLDYWLMRMAWHAEEDRTPEARIAYLRGLDRWFHDRRDENGVRVLHERFLELTLSRLVSTETVGSHGDFGVAMDFATQVEGSIKGTQRIEESLTSLQRTTACALLEHLAGDPARAGVERRRAFAKAQLYRATLVSRSAHVWLLDSAHERAERAMERMGDTLSAERGDAMRAELTRLRALRKQVGK